MKNICLKVLLNIRTCILKCTAYLKNSISFSSVINHDFYHGAFESRKKKFDLSLDM